MASQKSHNWKSTYHSIFDQRLQEIKNKLDKNSKMLPCEMRALRNNAKGVKPWCKLTKGHTLSQQRKSNA